MPLPKPEQAAKPGAMTMLVGDDAEKTELKLAKMGWQSHYPHSDKKTNDNFELSLPAKLEFSAANPALVLDLAASADAAAVKAAAQVFGEVTHVLRPTGATFAFVHFAKDADAARCVAQAVIVVAGAAVRAQPATRAAAEVTAWRASLTQGGPKPPSPDGSWEMVQPAAA